MVSHGSESEPKPPPKARKRRFRAALLGFSLAATPLHGQDTAPTSSAPQEKVEIVLRSFDSLSPAEFEKLVPPDLANPGEEFKKWEVGLCATTRVFVGYYKGRASIKAFTVPWIVPSGFTNDEMEDMSLSRFKEWKATLISECSLTS